MKKICEKENCTKKAVEKFRGQWLCRTHLCPEETHEYLFLERECLAGLKSISKQFEETVLDPIEFLDIDEKYFDTPESGKKDDAINTEVNLE